MTLKRECEQIRVQLGLDKGWYSPSDVDRTEEAQRCFSGSKMQAVGRSVDAQAGAGLLTGSSLASSPAVVPHESKNDASLKASHTGGDGVSNAVRSLVLLREGFLKAAQKA